MMFLLIHCATFGNHQQRCTLIHKRYKLFMLFRECVCVAFFNILFIPFEAQNSPYNLSKNEGHKVHLVCLDLKNKLKHNLKIFN